ncbi:hypothetical protein H112_04973 [Trichophyton rubrum D6]|uniref:Ankyrin repeat protein n=3 Tax=Trichophyton rubrum TaxID=5551 RepID=A0A178EPA6_TRIRU|nr:uncharacterized protein TERG_02743 [Trichophyton rubrum CBS 118892]EZF22054.1 hypothetical protein H100_04995 [Trichophyton rubrum MR850]EZF41097.1 hypothetical protein H102_04982 [Trichophyton rubrum CBS 100081]EZF51788.1 hypothetical protein H103_04984 [Trichophyton rubrum CBS 288.86]EZF62358.1 hypothetical protein H104_04976 [Trichophyton rubrum CBS 289.86]EZF83691.1 hypothetical protein H110_04982 [Trichophyton rubrum MR1448]EZF94373.1 hypothetical protein H113_05026 [Trichophyton rubr
MKAFFARSRHSLVPQQQQQGSPQDSHEQSPPTYPPQTSEAYLAPPPPYSETVGTPSNRPGAAVVETINTDTSASGSQTAARLASNNRRPLGDDEAALHLAVKNNHVSVVRALIKAGVDVSCADSSGWTPLQKAVSHQQEKAVEAVNALLIAGADVLAANNEGMTALGVAASKNLQGISDILLKAGAEINPSDPKTVSWSPYLLAAWSGHLELMKFYLNWGADAHAVNDGGWNALHIAVRQNHYPVIRFVLSTKKPLSVKSVIYDKRTALHIAAKYNNLEIARFLINSGTPIHARSEAGYTALHAATNEGHDEIALLLIESGSDVNAKGDDSWAPLALAVYHDKESTVRLLVEKGKANIEIKNSSGWTSLLLAARWGYVGIVKYLIGCGANPNIVSVRTRTALHMAALHQHGEIARMLVGLDIDVNAADEDGWMPLHMAARNGAENIVRLLLESGADPHAEFKPGGVSSSPLQLAAEEGHEKVVEMILQARKRVQKK